MSLKYEPASEPQHISVKPDLNPEPQAGAAEQGRGHLAPAWRLAGCDLSLSLSLTLTLTPLWGKLRGKAHLSDVNPHRNVPRFGAGLT